MSSTERKGSPPTTSNVSEKETGSSARRKSDTDRENSPPTRSADSERKMSSDKQQTDKEPGNVSDNEKKGSSPMASATLERGSGQQSHSDRAQELLRWTLTEVFDWNPDYAKQFRGILNIFQVILGILIMFLIGSACQMQPHSDIQSEGFYCKTADTFMFVITCSSVINSVLFLACCLLSKGTEKRLHNTIYEFVYYVTYSIFFCVASLTLTTNVTTRNKGHIQHEDDYNATLSGGAFGLVMGVTYAISAVWFYINHKKNGLSSSE